MDQDAREKQEKAIYETHSAARWPQPFFESSRTVAFLQFLAPCPAFFLIFSRCRLPFTSFVLLRMTLFLDTKIKAHTSGKTLCYCPFILLAHRATLPRLFVVVVTIEKRNLLQAVGAQFSVWPTLLSHVY